MKIFGIGLSKTGTSSLAHALEILGYRTKDNPGLERYESGDVSCVDPRLLTEYDALTDTPIPSFYRELDKAYPGSKFILTVREREGWLRSCQKQFTEKLAAKQNEAHNRLFLDLYGTTIFDAEKFAAGYERFVSGVLSYFENRPHDLLVLDIAAGEGWEKLCPFLEQPVPDLPFPKANVTRLRWMDLASLEAVARNAGEPLAHLHWALTGEGRTPTFTDRLAVRARLALGRDGAIRAAVEQVATRLTESLRRLTPEIPIVCPLDIQVSYEQRKYWNHLWLIDPLDGGEALGQPGGGFSVNISLIEDRRPVAGVVHDPVRGETYSAMIGKGAYRRDDESEPIRLDGKAARSDARPSASRALTLCQWIAGRPNPEHTITSCMEWQSAPAHILALMAGRRLVMVQGEAPPLYNKPSWEVETLCLR